jgi:ABC-type multidrug transport system ATPase subunit
MEPFLKVVNVTKRYSSITALYGIDLEIDEGQSLVLLGPNGAGKSTLLGTLAGRVRPTSGTVFLKGKDIRKSREARILTGYLSHSSLLYPGLTAQENLLLYASLYGLDNPGERVEEMLGLVGLWDRRSDKVGSFSRGMEQRLAIARSMLHDPGLLILDEPFSGLDHLSARTLVGVLGSFRDGRRTMLISTHDLDSVGLIGEQVAVIDRGKLRFKGKVPGDLKDLYVDLVREEKA